EMVERPILAPRISSLVGLIKATIGQHLVRITAMDVNDINKLIQRREIEDSLRGEFESALSERVSRYEEVKPPWVVPPTHFTAPSNECRLLFRDGHYYGCIALTQAVAEALVRYLCEQNSWEPDDQFEKNVRTLSKRGKITVASKGDLLKVWKKRNDYHHLTTKIQKNRQKLEELAREKVWLLFQIQKEVFRVGPGDVAGTLKLGKPKHWELTGDKVEVFLQLEP
ncbi:MAG: hypothetical protein V1724_04365, partial [Chloroflexota bacterium]